MKIDTSVIIKEYSSRKKDYEDLAETVDRILRDRISEHNIKIHSISYRLKETGSILDKMRRKGISNPFEQIHDIVGFRVVCLFLSDLAEIGNIIREEFDVFDEDDKVFNNEVDIFGYMSLHLKARLKKATKISHNIDIMEIPFEIQVRTIAQDAWASISHYLDYKKESMIPDEFKRDFHALSGLFYVADTHFLMINEQQAKQFTEKNRATTKNNSNSNNLHTDNPDLHLTNS